MANQIEFDYLCRALDASWQIDEVHRKESEAYLQAVSKKPGLLETLLCIVEHQELNLSLRTAAVVMLKNEIKENWRLPLPYSPQEKALVRNKLYPSLKSVGLKSSTIWRQLLECLRHVIISDYPSEWPQLLDILCEDLDQRTESNYLHCALATVKKLANCYEYAMDHLEELNQIVDRIFLPLLKAASDLTKVGIALPEVSTMLKLICKTYWSLTVMCLVSHPLFLKTFDEWMQLLMIILMERGNPQEMATYEALPLNPHMEWECERYPLFKLQTKTLQIFHRFLIRYGNKSQLAKGEESVLINEHMASRWSGQFISLFINKLRANLKGEELLNNRVKNLFLQCISQACEIADIYKFQIKPHGEFLLFEIAFPLLCYNDMDKQKWEEDPLEYVRTQTDFLDFFGNPRNAAHEFMGTIARFRGKDFLEKIFSFVHKIVQTYQTPPLAAMEEQPHINKHIDGALLMLGSIAERLTGKRRKVANEAFLKQFVLPLLGHPDKFLRMRACWTYEQFIGKITTWQEEEALLHAFTGILKCLSDNELPVQMCAGAAICSFFSMDVAPLRAVIVSNIPFLLERFLTLIKETQNDVVISAVEGLVTYYEKDILPFAKELVKALSQSLIEIFESSEEVEEEEVFIESVCTAFRTLKSLLYALRETPDIYLEISTFLMPVLSILFLPDNADYFEDGLELLTLLTFYLPHIPPSLWIFFEKMHEGVCGSPSSPPSTDPTASLLSTGWAADMVEIMVSPLENYMYHGVDTFGTALSNSGKSFKQLILEIVQRCFFAEPATVPRYGYELLCCLFESTYDKQLAIDMLQPTFVLIHPHIIAWNAEEKGLNITVKQCLLRLLATLLFYHPQTFFLTLEQAKATHMVFTIWLGNIALIKSISQKKATLLGFAKFLGALGDNSLTLPPSVAGSILLQQIVTHLANQFFEQLVLRQAKKEEKEECSSEGEYSEDSEQDLEDYEDAHVSAFTQCLLQNLEVKKREDEEDADFDESFGTDCSFTSMRVSPMEMVDEVRFVADTIKALPVPIQLQIEQWLGEPRFSEFKQALANA